MGKVKAVASLLVVATMLAVILIGVIALVMTDWRAQFVVFSVLAVIPAFVIAWRWLRQRRCTRRPLRQRLIGQMAEVRQVIPIGQRGDVLVGGVLWVAAAPLAQRELRRGEQVKITGIDGVVLLVEPVDDLSQKPPALQEERRWFG